ncbi:MAG: cytochrome oxidase putative small subunit CydP [Gammaproteobacteria bacterium]
MNTTKPTLPKPNLLRREITAALFVKLILLIGLWFMLFRWLQQPTTQTDIAEHFALPASRSPALSDFSSKH